MATIKDVASHAGVSIATVSRVLNGTGRCTPETEERVRRSVQELGYRTNLTARSLKTGRTGAVGIMLGEACLLESPEIVWTAVNVVQNLGFTVEMVLGADPMRSVSLLGEGRLDGLLLVDAQRDEVVLGDLLKIDRSFVLLGGNTDREDVNLVEIDHFGGAYTTTSELISMGHRRILFIEDNFAMIHTQEMKRGYLFALDENGIGYSEELLVHTAGNTSGNKEVLGYDAVKRKGKPVEYTAVLATHDRIAFGVLSAARELGIRVPEGLSVFGYGNVPQAAHSAPPLTTVMVPNTQLGELGAEILINNIKRQDRIVKRVTLQTQAVHRHTTARAKPSRAGRNR
jgi:LacI family transcriptional regulator